jgi:hypothetical protein
MIVSTRSRALESFTRIILRSKAEDEDPQTIGGRRDGVAADDKGATAFDGDT